MISETEALQMLENMGAFKAGHFVFTSGRHADKYINKDAVFVSPREVSRLALAMAERMADTQPDAVIGPAVGGALLSQWVAHHLSNICGREIEAVYADKDGNGGFIVKRGYDKRIAGKKVLVVEDLVTTGGSIKKVIDAVHPTGAHIVGAIAICNRGGVTKDMVGAPRFEALVNVVLDSWEETECDLCKRGIPINTDVGHGREYLKKLQKEV